MRSVYQALSPGYEATTKDSAPDHNSALTLVGVSKAQIHARGGGQPGWL